MNNRVHFQRTIHAFSALYLACSAPVFAGQPSPSACGTNGPLTVAPALTPATYTYTRGDAGGLPLSFTIQSPAVKTTGNCDSTLAPVFGNGNGTDPYKLPVAVSIGSITEGDSAQEVSDAIQGAIIAAINGSGVIESFILTPPGTGSHAVNFTFTNSAAIPVGTYSIEIKIIPQNGVGVGTPPSQYLTLTVSEPTLVDTLPPTVTILSPDSGTAACLHGTLTAAFTAIDPPEGGAGTGLLAMGATIESAGGRFSQDITDDLITDMDLPQDADMTVTANGGVTLNAIGSLVLSATADDGAGHQGAQQVSFSVSANVVVLPPVAVLNRQFKIGSTVPVKWTLTDCESRLLPPYASVSVEIYDSNGLLETRYAGDAASDIRWELDDSGNAVHYITNFQVLSGGLHTVRVYVNDVDDTPAQQGSFSFLAASKGGKY